MDRIEEGIANLAIKLSTSTANSSSTTRNSSSNPASSSGVPSVPRPAAKAKPDSKKEPQNRAEQRTTKACIIGDSISSNLDIKVIANAMKADVTAVRFPDKNFADVIDAAMTKSKPDIIIVQAGSEDQGE